MKVLHILNELRASGAEVTLCAAARYWQLQGIELHILSKRKEPGFFAPHLERAGYILHYIPFEQPLLFLLHYLKLLRKGRFDAVQIHAEHANFWIALLALCFRVKVVRTIHGIFLFQGMLRLERGLQRKLLSLLGVPHISIGASVCTIERDHYHNESQIIPNWYDSTRFNPVDSYDRTCARRYWGLNNSDLVILTVGNCSPIKNHRALLDALSLLPPWIPFFYGHVGEESDNDERTYAKQVGISSRVRFLGPVDDVTTLYQAADIFVMPSLHEGFGIAALEAMGSGLPVVLTDVPGLQDFHAVSDEIVWVQPNGPSLANGILTLAGMNHQERNELGLRLSDSVKERFSVEAGAHAYTTLWKQDG